ncbi:MAG: LapA family protein [Desulfobacterales bacterium]|nr:LapA family protein [Desulfobacterales bacterium]
MNFKLWLSLILAALALIFIIQNAAVVELHFLFWTVSMSRLVWMFLLLAIGFLIGWLLHSLHALRKK